MPELPEVETVRRTLENMIIGRKIKDIVVYYDKIIHADINDFKNKLIESTLVEINRLGKYLIFKFDNGTIMVSHLRMEGKYFYKDSSDEVVKHEHVIFKLDNGKDLRYHDVRKFGVMELKTEDTLYTTEPLSLLGPEATNVESKYLMDALNRNKPVKELLLDQSITAGIGNIYADEILFLSKVHPERLGNTLTKKEINSIADNSHKVLALAISDGGTTIRSYTSSLGVTGRFQQHLNVHTKEGEACPCCKEKIIKIRVGGRGTYFCPKCQH